MTDWTATNWTTTDDWTISIDVETGVDLGAGEADWLEDLAGRLAGTGASVSGHGSRISGTFTITDQPDCMAAAQAGITTFLHAAGGGIVVGIEAITVKEADGRLAEPTIPELVGASEAADILRVSRQRIHQLHTANAAFPEPVVEVRMGPLWTRASVEAFERAWTRKPGRPAGAVTAKSIAARPVAARKSTKNNIEQSQTAVRGTKVERAAVSGKTTGRRSGSSVRGSA